MSANSDRIVEIFNQAKAKPPGEDRQRLLDKACRNQPEWRAEIESMLRAFDAQGEPLETTRVVPELITEKPGNHIDRYKLLEKIGEGGMGAVWMAEQTEPVRRRVALKLIKQGMDSNQVLARFEAERQALALMDHPHIAKVLDAGATATGRPYFVMELVKGIPFTKFCDDQRLSICERLELFVPICQAIQHAHQKGIIHRDIKPSNVLVAIYDGAPVPKVIDFGVAKAIGQQLTERTLFTGFGAVIGTLEYMSPEQAEFNQLDIDTRSDIYSLGVLLYELLTGTTPITRDTIHKAAFDEVIRRIREEEPPRPSTRLSESKDLLPSISAQRKLDPAQLPKLIRGDLDWIVMKCLEKDRHRRYETASALAADLHHHLRNEVVSAGPPTARYRLRKFVHRHRSSVAVAAGFVLLLTLGTVLSTWLAVRANHARNDAEKRRQAETQARAEASRHRQLAQEALTDAELDRAEDLFAQGNSPRALAYLARVLRDNPSNHVAAERILSALTYRDFPLCTVAATAPNYDRRFHTATNTIVAVEPIGTVTVWDISSIRDRPDEVALGDRIPIESPIESSALSNDGQKLATLDRDGAMRIWHLPSKKLLTSSKHDPGSSLTGFNAAGNVVLTQMPTNYVLWDVKSGAKLGNIPSSSSESYSQRLYLSPDDRWIVSHARNVGRIWDARACAPASETFACLDYWKRDSVQFRSDAGVMLVLGGGDQDKLLFDFTSGKPVSRILESSKRMDRGQFTSDGKSIILCQTSSAGLWDIATGRRTRSFRLETAGLNRGGHFSAISPNALTIVTGFSNSFARFWDSQTGRPLGAPFRTVDTVSSALFSEEDLRVLLTDLSGRARLWHLAAQPQRSEPFTIQESRMGSTRFSGESTRLVAKDFNSVAVFDTRPGMALTDSLRLAGSSRVSFNSRGDRVVIVGNSQFEVRDVRSLRVLLGPLKHPSVQSAEFNNSGSRLLSLSQTAARTWNAETGEPIGKTIPFESNTGRFSPDGTRVAGYSAGYIQIWDIDDGELLIKQSSRRLPGDSLLQFSADSERLLAETGDYHRSYVHLWNARTGQVITNLPAQNLSGEFCRDGTRFIISDREQTHVLDGFSGKLITTIPQHAVNSWSGSDYSAAMSGDGLRVAIQWIGDVRVWDATTGQAISETMRHTAKIRSVAFNYTGNRVITTAEDNTIQIWDANSGRPLSRPIHYYTPEMAFTDDGLRMALQNSEITVQVWDLQMGRPISESFTTGEIWSSEFSPLGNQLFTPQNGRTMFMWDLPSCNREAPPSWLPELAEAVVGERLDVRRVSDPVPREELIRLRQRILSSPGSNSVTAWAKWFFAERETRTTSPFSMTTVPEYVERRIEENTQQSLSQALILSPRNPVAWSRMASVLLSNPTNEPWAGGDAKSCLERALSLAPQNIEVLLALARASEASGQLEQAVEALNKVIASPNTGQSVGTNVFPRALFDRSRILKQLGRAIEGQADWLRAKDIAPRDSRSTQNQIDLANFFNASPLDDWQGLGEKNNNLAQLPRGLQMLAGTPFEVRGVVQLAGGQLKRKRSPEYPQEIVGLDVHHEFRQLHFLHGVEGRTNSGVRVAKYVIHYADNSKAEMPVIYGEDVRGWMYQTNNPSQTTRAVIAWSGGQQWLTNWPGWGIRLYKSTWINPRPDMVIKTVDYVSEMEMPAPFLLAITGDQ
jgi:eukaryotic-like serine/threonine-protein kinase